MTQTFPSKINWTIATDNQLLTIIEHEKDLPSSLLRGAVIEGLNRGLFDSLIADCIRRIFPDLKLTEQMQKMSLEDFMQLGREYAFKALERYNPKRGMNFMSFVHLRVKGEMYKLRQGFQYQKRDANKLVSMNNKTDEGTEYAEFFRDPYIDVEKYVIDKVLAEELLSRVNEHQQKIVMYRLQGYELNEIAEILGRGTASTISGSFYRAIENMRKGA